MAFALPALRPCTLRLNCKHKHWMIGYVYGSSGKGHEPAGDALGRTTHCRAGPLVCPHAFPLDRIGNPSSCIPWTPSQVAVAPAEQSGRCPGLCIRRCGNARSVLRREPHRCDPARARQVANFSSACVFGSAWRSSQRYRSQEPDDRGHGPPLRCACRGDDGSDALGRRTASQEVGQAKLLRLSVDCTHGNPRNQRPLPARWGGRQGQRWSCGLTDRGGTHCSGGPCTSDLAEIPAAEKP